MKKKLNAQINPLEMLIEQKEKLENLNVELDDLGYVTPEEPEISSESDSSISMKFHRDHESKSTDNNFAKKRGSKLISKSPNKPINKTDYNFYKRPGCLFYINNSFNKIILQFQNKISNSRKA